MKDDPTDIRSAAMDAFVEQPVQPASTCRKHENTVVHMAGQPVQPAPTCMEHAHTLQLALNAELAERCFEQKQHMRILAELHVEIASLKRGRNETAALFSHSPNQSC